MPNIKGGVAPKQIFMQVEFWACPEQYAWLCVDLL